VRKILYDAGLSIGASMQWGGTYINIEGPAFSTLAESQTYRSGGMDVVGMTQMTEARLAREAEICYATVAMVTDYDCWYEEESGSTVSVEGVIEYLTKNAATARELVITALASFPLEQNCECGNALSGAIITDRSKWPEETITKLKPLLDKYL
jgi:5'-methylthioadenosine phosphorylase